MSEELKIPEQHAFETGNLVQPARPGDGVIVTMIEGATLSPGGRLSGGTPTVVTGAAHFSAPHNAAAILHGWGKKDEAWGHRHHAGEPIKLSRADYTAALEAAGKTNELGEYEPHPGALSEHCEARDHHKHVAKRVAEHRKARDEAEKSKGEKRTPRAAAETTEAAKV